jgi:hypothetical protein
MTIEASKDGFEPYSLGLGNLTFGYKFKNLTIVKTKEMNSTSQNLYHPPPESYNGRQIGESLTPLLDAVIQNLGTDPQESAQSFETLLHGLEACLDIIGRESTLPLYYGTEDLSRLEIASQASKISKILIQCARVASKTSRNNLDGAITSRCEGHTWTQEVASLLFGTRSKSNL